MLIDPSDLLYALSIFVTMLSFLFSIFHFSKKNIPLIIILFLMAGSNLFLDYMPSFMYDVMYILITIYLMKDKFRLIDNEKLRCEKCKFKCKD